MTKMMLPAGHTATARSPSPWRRGCNWLSGGGCSEKRVRTAAKRERIANERYPGAHKRPAIHLDPWHADGNTRK